MNEQEFLKQATSEIYSIRKCQYIVCELHDHITLREERYMEMGYSESDAEEKSIEEMGDPIELAKKLGKLYKSYNPFTDIVLLLVYFAVLSGLYYVERTFIFGDPGALSMLICGIIGIAAVFFLYAAYASSKKHPAAAVCAFAAGAGGVYFEYLIGNELNRLTDGNFTNIKNFITENEIYFSRYQTDISVLMTLLRVTGAIFTVFCTAILIYGIKKSYFANNSKDNKINKIITVLCLVIFTAGVIAAAGFGLNTFRQIKEFEEEYNDAYKFATEIESSCSTQGELAQFLSSSEYDFGPIDFNNAKVYTYSHNLVYICISLYEPIEDEEGEKERGIAKLINNLEKKKDYAARYVYSVHLTTNTSRFDNGYDSLSLSVLKSDEEMIEKLYSYIPYEHTPEERYEYFKSFVPVEFRYEKCCRELVESDFDFKYIDGTGELKDTHSFYIKTGTQRMLDFRERENEITEILKNNDTVDPIEIASITGTTLIEPVISEEEYKQLITELCDYSGKNSELYQYKDELSDNYSWFYRYSIYDDWYFYIFRSDELNFLVFDNDFDIFDYLVNPKDAYLHSINLDGNPVISTSEYGVFEKIMVNSGYFDKLGLYYDSAENVRYYSEDGTVYHYHSEIDYEEKIEDSKKNYYLIDDRSNTYPADKCFIDENGWLVIADDIKADRNGIYKNEKGETFTPAFKTSWDENGNIMKLSDYYS